MNSKQSWLRKYSLIVLVIFFCLEVSFEVSSQKLKELKITPSSTQQEASDFQSNKEYPEAALLIVRSTITNLKFRSSQGPFSIIKQRYNKSLNRYEILLNPEKQSIKVFGFGFKEADFGKISYKASQVLYFEVTEIDLEKDLNITNITTETKTNSKITVNSIPTGASIQINDNKTIYKTPYTFELPEGKTRLKLNLNRYQNFDSTFQISSGQNLRLDARLKPAWADLKIKTEPEQAEIFLNNVLLGKGELNLTGPRDGLLPGLYILQVKLDQYQAQTSEFQLFPGEEKTLSLSLKRAEGLIRIGSAPAGAELSINGEVVGKTPFQKVYPTGEYEGSLKLKKHRTENFIIQINGDEGFTLNRELQSFKNEAKPLRRLTSTFYTLGFAGLAAGGYLWYSGNINFDKYQTATTTANDLRKKIDFSDKYSPISLVAGGAAIAFAIVISARISGLRKKWELSAVPLKDGGAFMVTHKIGIK